MKLYTLIITFLLYSSLSSHASLDDKLLKVESEVMARNVALNNDYLNRTNQKFGIRHYGTSKTNQAIFLRGNDKLVILYHGFMASPFEMLSLGEYLRDKTGSSIYIPIIPGFAAHYKVNGKYNFKEWQESVKDNIDFMKQHFSHISLVGYSIGAGLLADYSLRNELDEKIKSLTLLSPFYKGAPWQVTFLGATVTGGLLSTLNKLFKVKKIKLETVDKIVKGKYRDLDIILKDKVNYTQVFSVKAATTLMQLTRSLKLIRNSKSIDIPVFLGYSKADQTISWRYAKRFTKRHFKNIESTYIINKEQAVPHEIVVPDKELNPNFLELFSGVSDFISSH